MTREEDLIRIAKKLDKMVSRNNTVRVCFDARRWRGVLPPRAARTGPVNVSALEEASGLPLGFNAAGRFISRVCTVAT